MVVGGWQGMVLGRLEQNGGREMLFWALMLVTDGVCG